MPTTSENMALRIRDACTQVIREFLPSVHFFKKRIEAGGHQIEASL